MKTYENRFYDLWLWGVTIDTGSLNESLRYGMPMAITGVGKSGLLAQLGASMMRSVGLNVIYLRPEDALHGEMALLENRALMVLSYSGESEEWRPMVERAIAKGNEVIAVTHDPSSWLAKKSTMLLQLPTIEEKLPMVQSLAILNIINNIVDKEMPSEAYIAKTHPGGAIGRHFAVLPNADEAG